MPHLIAQGELPQQRWRRALVSGREIVVGRTAVGWGIPWDDRISRRHASIRLLDEGLRVERLPGARNPIFYRGAADDSFVLGLGEHFVIGSTTFALVEEHLAITQDAPSPQAEKTFSRRMLEDVPYRDASRQIDAISRLPDVIAGAASDDELFVKLIGLLFRAIESASFVAVVTIHSRTDSTRSEILQWDRRPGESATVAPSERLIRRAVDGQESIVHLWRGDATQTGRSYTLAGESDWAFCTPVRGESCQGWAIYVAGGADTSAIQDASDLQDSVKFTELVAITLAQLRDLRRLERQKSTLGQFISPVVLDAVAERDPEAALAPRQANVSVLFCDLRGFSLKSERSVDDLMGLLNRVSLALGVMTRQILAQDGVIGDFHGDAAMGFWGWPLEQENLAQQACRAALRIFEDFAVAQQPNHPLADFQVGIGIATGPAVAGKIGTIDQVKVTVFGPVVNLAARLEAMTSTLRAPILIDEATASAIRASLPPSAARVRRVARIRPYGLETSVEVSQLLPPESAYPQLNDEHIAAYESALDALLERDWEKAFELLHRVPAEDRVKDFLTVFIAQNNRTPPRDWDGIIPIGAK